MTSTFANCHSFTENYAIPTLCGLVISIVKLFCRNPIHHFCEVVKMPTLCGLIISVVELFWRNSVHHFCEIVKIPTLCGLVISIVKLFWRNPIHHLCEIDSQTKVLSVSVLYSFSSSNIIHFFNSLRDVSITSVVVCQLQTHWYLVMFQNFGLDAELF